MSKPDFTPGPANGGQGGSPYDTMLKLKAFADEVYSDLGDGTDLSARLAALVALASNGLIYINSGTLGVRSMGDSADIQWTNADGGAGDPAPTLKTNGVAAGTYTLPSVTVDGTGRVTSISSGTTASGGEANTAVNVGGGEGICAAKNGAELQFKSLVAGSGITLTSASQTITVAAAAGDVASVFGRTGAVVAVAGDYQADEITFTPAGNIAATDVQAAIAELDSEKAPVASPTFTGTATIPTLSCTVTATLQALTVTAAATVGGDLTVTGNLTITGNMTVNGTTVTVNATTVEVADNVMLLNNGEVGAGVTAGSSGIEVDRGSETNYQFIFRESDDTFVVGQVGLLQAVATREDTPTDNAVAVWDAATSKFETIAGFTWDGTTLTVPGSVRVEDGAPVNQQTGTTYTLVAADAGKVVECLNASAITVTVPANATTAFAVGTIITLEQTGAGQVTISGAGGVTINHVDSHTKIKGQHGVVSIRKTATDAWTLYGATAA